MVSFSYAGNLKLTCCFQTRGGGDFGLVFTQGYTPPTMFSDFPSQIK